MGASCTRDKIYRSLKFNDGFTEKRLLTTEDTEEYGEKLKYLLIKLSFQVF